MTGMVSEFEDMDGRGHGARIETLLMFVSEVLPLSYHDPWFY
jgi:hypothetical protein